MRSDSGEPHARLNLILRRSMQSFSSVSQRERPENAFGDWLAFDADYDPKCAVIENKGIRAVACPFYYLRADGPDHEADRKKKDAVWESKGDVRATAKKTTHPTKRASTAPPQRPNSSNLWRRRKSPS